MKMNRILLKLSGEALAGEKHTGFDETVVRDVAKQVKAICEKNIQVSIVIGGGNFWRGRSSGKMDRTRADHMGMLATVINSLALQSALEAAGVNTRVQTAIEMRQIAEPYIRGKAASHLAKGRVVIFGCGTGNPFFSTDTGAALRAAEIEADVFMKATMVDGVYDKDPNVHKDAIRFDTVSHDEVLRMNLKVMDATAAALCRDNKTQILVFSMADPKNIVRIIHGEKIGTLVK